MPTLQKATMILEELTQKEKLSLQESLQAFQLCLALGRSKQASLLADYYIDLLHMEFFNVVCHIDTKESISFFKRFRFYWDHHISVECKLYYAAILLQQGIVANYNLCVELGINKSDTELFGEANQLNLTALSLEELEKKCNEAKIKMRLASLPFLVMQTDSIELVDQVLGAYQFSEEDRINLLLYKARLLSKTEYQKSLEIISQVEHSPFMRYCIKEEKYHMACDLASKSIEDAQLLMRDIRDVEYAYGFSAAVAVANDDKKSFQEMLGCIKNTRKDFLDSYNTLNNEEYFRVIERIFFTIAPYWSESALKLYEELCTLCEDGLYLNQSVAVLLFPHDPHKAFKIISNIVSIIQDDDGYWSFEEALVEMAKLTDDPQLLTTLLKFVDSIDSSAMKYAVMQILQYKMELSFEDMYQLCSRISPYDDIQYDKETSIARFKRLFDTKLTE